MGKRGQMQHELMITIFDLVLIGMLFLSLMGYVSSIQSMDFVKKEYLSKDLALLINTVYASPRDITVYYDSGISDFTFEFQNQRATVYETEVEKGEPTKVYYPFAIDRNIARQFAKIEGPDQIAISKSHDTLSIDESSVPTETEACPDVYTRDDDPTIMLDPGHGGTDTGYTGEVEEAQLVYDIAKQLEQVLPGTVVSTRELTLSKVSLAPDLSTEDRLGKIELHEPDMLVSLHCGKAQDSQEVIIYINYYNTQTVRNKKLACLIKNRFIEEFEGLDVRVRNIRPEQFGDPRRVLSTEGMPRAPVGVYIEMGNVNTPLDSSILASKGSLGMEGTGKIINDVIAPAIRQYYE